MTTYQRETFDQAYSEALPLLRAHFAEISDSSDVGLEPNIDAYQASEKEGFLRVYTVRKEGILVGYVAMFVYKGIHNSSDIQATQDVFYVDPVYRGGQLGIHLIKFVENELRKESVNIIYQTAKLKHPTLGLLLEHSGYTAIETVYQRRLT